MFLDNVNKYFSDIFNEIGITQDYILLLAAIASFLSVFLFCIAFVPKEDTYRATIYGYRKRKRELLIKENILYKLTLPSVELLGYYVSKFSGSLGWLNRYRTEWKESLLKGGYWGAYTVDEYIGLMIIVMFGGWIAGLYFSYFIAHSIELPIAFLFAIVGLAWPILSVKFAIKNRIFSAERELFSIIDLLVLSMRAGLDFISALKKVVDQGLEDDPENPMIQELGIVLQEMQMGTARSDAFLNMVKRIPSDYIKSMVGAIVQAETRGTPLAKILDIQIDTIRKKRSQRVEKQASQAAVKILLPLMFIFLSVITVVGGAIYMKVKLNQ